jgi:hypothetical protein
MPSAAPIPATPVVEQHATPTDALERPAPVMSTPVESVSIAHAAPESVVGAPPAQTAPEPWRDASPSPAREPEPLLPRNAPEIPRVSLELPSDSGLVLVETSHAAAAMESEPEPARPRRVRPPRVQTADEQLQMVETTHKEPPTM